MEQVTQVKHPWRATVRTVFQALVGLCAMWALVVGALGLSPTLPWVALSLAISAGVTRVMALPEVNAWLNTYFRWLASE